MRTRFVFLAVVVAATGRSGNAQVNVESNLAPVNGGQIEYVVTGPESGEPLLLVHGAGLGTALALIQAEPALAEFRVIRMHRRGFIGSSSPVGPMSVADHAADALGLLDALGVERAHVAGYSIGGGMVLEIAAGAPDRLETLILLDPAPASGLGLPNPIVVAMSPGGPLDPARAPTDAASAIAAFSSVVSGDDWREFFDAVPGGFAQAVADFPREIPGAPPWIFSRAKIEAVETPTLVVWGSESILRDHSMALAEALPDAEGREITETDHSLVGQEPAEIAEAMAEFIGRHHMSSAAR